MKRLIKKQYNQHKETIHNFIWRALQLLGKSLATFSIFILCAKLLNPYDFGIYTYTLAIIFFLIIFGDFGISTATSKYVAQYNSTNKNKLKLILFNSGIIVLGVTIIVTVIVLLFGPLFLKEKYSYVLWLLPLIFLAPMTSLYDGIYRGLKRFKQLALISIIVGIISLSFVYILIKQYGLIGALISQVGFYLFLFIALASGYKEFKIKYDKTIAKSILKYSLIIGLANVGYFLYTKINTLILGNYGLIIQVGYYEFITKIFEIIIMPFIIFGQITAPNITKIYLSDRKKSLYSRFNRELIILAGLGIIISLFLIPIFNFSLKIWFPQFNNSEMKMLFNILIWVLPLRIVASFVSNAHTVATGNAHYSLWTVFIAGIINICLCLLLIPLLGLRGVAYASLASFSFAIVSFIFLYWRKLRSLS